jgi:hypothetical protein
MCINFMALKMGISKAQIFRIMHARSVELAAHNPVEATNRRRMRRDKLKFSLISKLVFVHFRKHFVHGAALGRFEHTV